MRVIRAWSRADRARVPPMASNEQGPGNILTAVDDGILHVEIKRPEKKNALTGAMYQALADAIDLAAQSAQIRVILLHGQPDVFTSGNDLKDFLQDPALDDEHVAYRFVRAISRATKPIVAAVNGACVGVGATLLLHCDLVYAGQGATFALPFVNLGLCPEAGSSLLLPLVAGRARAAELLLLGEPFSAARAEACGMILPEGWRGRFPCDARAPMVGTWRGFGAAFLLRRARVVGRDPSERIHPSALEVEPRRWQMPRLRVPFTRG